MKTLAEMRKRRAELAIELRAMIDKARSEDREFTDEEAAAYDAGEVELRSLRENIQREERLEEVEKEREVRSVREPGPDPDPIDPELRGGTPRQPVKAPALHLREDRSYSILALARSYKNQDPRERRVEQRASDEIAERIGRQPENGIFIPYAQLLAGELREKWQREQRDITKATTGADLVGTDLLPRQFIELLRNETLVVRAGATIVDGLQGDVDIPRQAAAGVVTWLAAETTDLTTDTTFDTDKVSLTPKTVGVRHDISRRMLKQSSPGIEELVRNDIRATIGISIDSQAIVGDGTGGTPSGIIDNATGAVDLTGGATWADIVEFETDLDSANALRGRLAYAVRPATAGTLKTTQKDAGSGLFLMDSNGQMNGYNVFVSNQIPATQPIIFGNFAELLIGMWGILDVQFDPFTLGDRGGVVLRGFQDIDVALRHNESFSVGS